ncbi:prevent-host-death family protein [Nitrosospira multiformis ATCC 25196]|uniref:Antitoxin n=2 Tax=Nitrosospira multiformis (strain ATCC 25196 / NCIMB 11849 / C 71) TaxID=323848 RepID=A0A1H5XUG6_NITMU|nr:prevent-host-death family protein [Nitrosospira multiformis ATCC 25196]
MGFYMKAIAAKEAKNNFGEMLDTVQREPLTIEKHGRAVAVVMSAREYQQMKLERLQAKLAVGEGQLNRGEGVDGEAVFAELLSEA